MPALFGARERAVPAAHVALDPARTPGRVEPLVLRPPRVHALGLTYAAHINETASDGEGVAIFAKDPASILVGDEVASPSREALLEAIARLDPALARTVDARFADLPPLLDYEVELGLVLLDDVTEAQFADAAWAPPVGWFVANDVTARVVQVLGEGRPDRMAFWGAAKSFPGFLVAGPHVWLPGPTAPDACLDVTLTLRVNGEIRQQGRTLDLVATPRELLRMAARAGGGLAKGEVVLTGTPSGVAFAVPGWKRAVAALLPGATTRLAAALRSHAQNPRLLRPGDVVEIDGGVLGTRRIVVR